MTTGHETGRPSLLVGTGNRGKIRELEELLAGVPLEICGLGDFPGLIEVEETGATFRENADLKAAGYARQSGQLSLADDSGLEVFALGGAPGVLSARFAGVENGYDVKITELLRQLDAAGTSDRRARFACAMSLASADGRIIFRTEGVCGGTIAEAPRGSGGFGYDPIFVPDGFDRTFGELDGEIKQQISHRARASREIVRYLLDFIVV